MMPHVPQPLVSSDLRTADFDYQLPPELIAQSPPEKRQLARLLKVAANGNLTDDEFSGVLQEIKPEDCLIFNNTRVIPARLITYKPTGGKVEIMLERIESEHSLLALAKSSKPLKKGQLLQLNDVNVLTFVQRVGLFFQFEACEGVDLLTLFTEDGAIPLPPYIKRSAVESDLERYQTVYAQNLGAVAAPTAGLHFTDELLSSIKTKGIKTGSVTLHVGAGTFRPVQVDNVNEHIMHAERIEVSEDVVQTILATKKAGGRVFAVGTTTVRALESAAAQTPGMLEAFEGETSLFITPGYSFKVVDALITNFHLPRSTLLMMISAFAGKPLVEAAYDHAIAQAYRFFSYGDAMLLHKQS